MLYVHIRMKRGHVKLTLSVNEKILKEYKKHCEEKGLVISKQVEKFMEEKLENEKDKS